MLLALAIPAGAVSAQVQTVGQVDQVQDALGIFAERTWLLKVEQPVQIGLTLSLRHPSSYVEIGLDVPVEAGGTVHAGSFRSEGLSRITIKEARWEEPAKKLFYRLKLDQGTLWMALGQLVLHQVWVRTPQLKALALDTSFRVLVDPIVGTFLAADKGSVQAKLTRAGEDEENGDEEEKTGETFLVTAGHWLLVPPAGPIQRGPASEAPPGLEDPPLLDCCDFRTAPP